MNKRQLRTGVLVAAMGAVVILGVRRWVVEDETPGARNVLLVTLDTTRADRIGCYGYSAASTPTLDQLASKGVLFEQAFSNVPMTLPSHTTIMTGLLPPEHGLRVNGADRLSDEVQSMATMLQDAGYETGAFIASFTLDSRNGLDRGFDVYDDDQSTAYDHHEDEPLTIYRSGDVVTDSALAWLEDRNEERPFFCWVHLFDPHKPYHYHDILSGGPHQGKATYDSEIAFADTQVARLMAFLEREDLTDNTLVIAVGDHGEGLGQHEEPAHGYMVFETTLSVPLIISLPGAVEQGRRTEAVVSLVDVFPTVLDLLDLAGMEGLPGRSLKGALDGHEIESVSSYGESVMPYTFYGWSPLTSLTTPQWKYIRSSRRRLFDRRTDKEELKNLAEEHPEKVAELEKELASIEEEMELREAVRGVETAEAAARLRDLGYVGREGRPVGASLEKVVIDGLRDIEDALPVLHMVPTMRDLRRRGKIAELKVLCKEMLRLSPESDEIRRDLGEALIKAGELEEGVAEYEAYLQKVPDDGPIHYHAGLVLAELGRNEEAKNHFKATLVVSPTDANAHGKLAMVLQELGDLEAAVEHYREALRTMPGGAVMHHNLGVILEGQGDLEGAVHHYAEARRLDPMQFQPPLNVGEIHLRRDRFPEAIAYYSKAVEEAPEDATRHVDLAKACELAGELDKAATHYKESLRLAPGDPRIQYRLGTVLGRQGDLGQATKLLSEAVRLEPGNVSARNNLGLALARQEKLDEAAEQFLAVLKLRPDNALAHRNLGDVYQRQAKVADAVKQYSESVRIQPDDGRSHKSLGIALGRQGKFEAALAAFTEALRIDPKDGHACFLRGGMLEAQGKIKAALGEHRAALRLRPGMAPAANSLAWLLATHADAEIRDGAEAVKYGEQACEATSNKDPGMLDSLAAAYAEAGRFEEAVATARRAITLATEAKRQSLADEIGSRLALYEAGKAYHVGP